MTGRVCSIDGCTRPHKGRGWCKLHLQRWHRQGDPLMVGVPKAPPGERHHNWAGDLVGYYGAHFRVRRARGSAATRYCQQCGAPARHWAYDNADPNELRDERGRRYSPDADHYLPLCVPCHSRHDAEARAAA